MKKSFSNILNIVLIAVIFIMVASSVSNGASYSEAGSATDPLVTLSYVEERIALLNANFEERIKNLENNKSSIQASSMMAYEVVEVHAGQTINLEANTHFILRAGEATAIAGVGGGLSDLTIGVDLKTGDVLTKNHLLLIPKSDGRGVNMSTYGWVMISGEYSIQ